ncbi:type VI secretion system tip protein VgrG [Nannocystis sp. ILAH1]|uniref:type VI secretion system Vgr family protein n=1 Tax=Nannocystis sp. ILAH1 TaxID=2996789 RepID=UPI0022716AF5|nr:type VI secretion system tip protein VgrG [Nannocystis sp. ILAH1]MCY0995345.1 type VI secretion system tip protein VgrG [Nannocystis sp. ILAH1]
MNQPDLVSSGSGSLGDLSVFTLDVADLPLHVVRFTGQEGISEQFRFAVEVASAAEIDPETFVGQPALLTIQGLDVDRVVHGIVCEAEYIGATRYLQRYELIVEPWAHRLHHRHDCRIFQDKTTQQIVTEVLTKAGLPRDWFRFSLTGTYAPRNYCVQYRESDLAFVSRLLEEDGIFYFYEHEQSRHVWVMADHVGAHGPIPGTSTVWFNRPNNLVQDREHVKELQIGSRVRTGKVTLRDLNLHRPDQSMEVKEAAKYSPELEQYDFPGEYQDPGRAGPHQGQTMARIRLEAHQATRRQAVGTSDCPRLFAGAVMTLVGHPHEELNGEYRLVRVEHKGEQPQALQEDASGEMSYHNSFTATELKVPFRPTRTTPRPAVRGVQTATVVGPAGEEIHTDEHGRVRVQFHWDREGEHDERSTCWVRVSQAWAGHGWGAMFLPRIGHEVLVDFIEGDPDRPIITGRIYHGMNETPYTLPEHKTRSTIKSDSSIGGGGYNELRFEDKKNGEQIFLHAERNIDVRVNNDAFSTVFRHSHVTVGNDEQGKAGDSFVQLYHDHHLKVHRHTTAHLGGDVQLLVGGIDAPGRVDMHVRSDKLELIDGDSHAHVRKSLLEKVDDSVSRIVGGNEQARIAGRLAVEAGDEIHFKASKIVLDAGDALTIQGPGGFITIDAGGIYIKGSMVYINSAGSPVRAAAADPRTAADAKDAEPQHAIESERGSK